VAEIIGISGYAGCGKDLFFNLFKEELSKRGATAERVAIADPLKLEVRDTLLQLKGIDPMNCSRTQKDEIRDLLVFYGCQKRNETHGRYWTNKASKTIKDLSDKFDFICVTDVRFNKFVRDEVSWVKSELGGKLLVIKQFLLSYDDPYKVKKTLQTAPNSTEEWNMKRVEKDCDFMLEWPFSEDSSHIEENLRPAVREFVNSHYENRSK
jgi:hypothetical protein|tara:strand:- start:261 stop:887 length:627 start_codon:yes stop_codon:yes gene_type:complete